MKDLIERQAAIEALDKRFKSIPMEQTTEILLLRKDLRNLPSAQPQRMRGKWTYGEDEKSSIKQNKKKKSRQVEKSSDGFFCQIQPGSLNAVLI